MAVIASISFLVPREERERESGGIILVLVEN